VSDRYDYFDRLLMPPIWKLMIHLSRTLTPDFVPLVAVPRLEEMGDDRLYVYRHTVLSHLDLRRQNY
jgi:hypothetical protein